jgi:DNA-binding NarL/FixJ family response regulator
MKERVLIATNEPMLAKGLEASLTAGGVEVCAVCYDVFELFDKILSARPAIAIIDVPVLPGPEVIGELLTLAPKCQIVVWPRPIARRGVEEAIRHGARGVLSAETAPKRLAEILTMLVNFPDPNRGPAQVVSETCSPLERRYLAMVGHGLDNQEIAAAMGSDESTIQELQRSVSDRLRVEDRYELALFGLSTLNQSNSQTQGEGSWTGEIAID